MNDIGEVLITLARPVCFELYDVNRDAGGFILIDRESFNTSALGLIVGQGDTPVQQRLWLADAMEWLRSSAEHPIRSVAKVASWRVIGSATTMAVAYAITGDLRVSAAIGAAEIIAKVVLSYTHERLWSRVKFGLQGLSLSGKTR